MAMLTLVAAPATAATQSEFYVNLLRRGMASYDGSRYSDAAKELRIAAFGLVEAVEQYQLAQMYLTLTYDKLGLADRARDAAQRVATAQRVERRYAAVAAPQPVRTAFEVLAARLLSPAEIAILRGAPAPASVTPAATTPPQQTSAAPAQRKATPAKPPAPKPQPAPEKPAPEKPESEKPAPKTAAAKPVAKPQPPAPAATIGRGGPIEPERPAAPAPRGLSATEINTRLASAESALNGADLDGARRMYRELLAAPGLDHDALVRVAEGLYRSRDFAATLNAFARAGALRRGEEPYRYYIAVAAYETGDHARARKELAAALPYIEITPDVARYRTRIEGAQ